ncbi:MAG: ABC transporter permease, partial [Thiohalophilus sp.]
MFKPFDLYIGLRYTRAKRRNHFISFISLTSMLGITLGVMALITVLSVMNGFEKEVRDRILDMVSHLTITDYQRGVRDWQAVSKAAEENPRVVTTAPYVEGEGMLIHGKGVNGARIRGVLPDREPGVSAV